MSRKRLPRGREDLFSRHPLRIVRALKTGELDPPDYLILKFLVDEIEAPGREGEAIYTLEELARLIGWPHTLEWLRQKLHGLRDAGWIDFDEPRAVRNAAWAFRLRRAAIDGQGPEPPTDLQLETPSELEVTSNPPDEQDSAIRRPVSTLGEPEPPTGVTPEQSGAETETENLCSEGSKENDVGKTTAAPTDPAITDRLIALVRGEPPVRVEPAEDGSLDWSAEPVECEHGVLADVQALVDAGLAEWIEDDAEGER